MMSQAVLNVRMDESLKNEFDSVCKEMGLNASSAINVFVKTVVRERCLPFTVRAAYKEQEGLEAFYSLRKEAARNGLSGLSLDEINDEINKAREGI